MQDKDMLNILKNFDSAEKGESVSTVSSQDTNGMKTILESFNAVSEAPMPVPVSSPAPMPQEPQGQPVTMNVSLNASGKDHVDDLLSLMQNAGLSGASQLDKGDGILDIDTDGDYQPDLDINSDMSKFRNIIDGPKVESIIEDATLIAQELKKMGVSSNASEDEIYKMIPKALKSLNLGSVLRQMNISKGYRQDMVSDILDAVSGMKEEDSKHAEPEDPDSVFARLGNDIQEIMNDALAGNDMAEEIADELGDYLRNGDAPEDSHYEKAISIVMDAIHDGPDAQAEAAEEAISFLHMEEEKARGNPNYDDTNEWANSPEGSEGDEEYKDARHMYKDLSGGLNREKKQFAKAQDGDNAMAVESIKSQLLKALAEKMDPVGQEDDDVNNDGKEDSSDEYLKKRRAAIAKATAKKGSKKK